MVDNESFHEELWLNFPSHRASINMTPRLNECLKREKPTVPEFEKAFPFREGLALMKLDGKCGFISKTEKLVSRYLFLLRFKHHLPKTTIEPSNKADSITAGAKSALRARKLNPITGRRIICTITLRNGCAATCSAISGDIR